MSFEVELYTAEHVIRGQLETAGERVSNALNNKTESALFLRNVQVTRLLNVTNEPPLVLPVARVCKEQLLLAIPVAERDLTHKALYRRAARQTYQIAVSLPNFELRGNIHLTERLDIRRVLVVRPDDFIPLTNATATFVLHPRVVVEANTIIFNKTKVSFIGELE